MLSERTTAKIIGTLFLLAFFAYGIGTSITSSIFTSSNYLKELPNHHSQFVIGALLMLANAPIVAGIGIFFFPILKQHNEHIAISYLSFRILEAILLLIGVISLLLLVFIGQEYATNDAPYFQILGYLAIKGNFLAYQIAMLILGIGSIPFCYLLYQSNLVPRFISILGMIGYLVFLTGVICELFGIPIGILLSIPGGIFEVVFACYLLFKGLNLPQTPPSQQLSS